MKYYIYKMNMTFLNILSILLMVITFIPALFYTYNNMTYLDFKIIAILLVPYLILHEILHSISYVIHGASFKNIYYGAHLEKGVLCCLCKENISKKNILISLMYPFIIIGVITLIIGIIIHSNILIWLSIVNITGCSGDLCMFFNFLKIKDFEYTEFDDPTGFAIYTKNDLSKRKMIGLDYIKKANEVEKTKSKKVDISKISIIFFIIYAIIMIL